MKAANATKPAVVATENQLVLAIAQAMEVQGKATAQWRDVVAPGMIRIYRTIETATEARDRLIERAITPCLGKQYREAMAMVLPDTRSKMGKTVYDQNVKTWKISMTPEWVSEWAETLKDKTERANVTKACKTYAGFVEMVQDLKASARSQGKVQFKRICMYAWPEAFEKPEGNAKPAAKPEGDAKPEDSKLNPTQTLVSLINTARTYAQGKDGLPSQPAVIAHLTKAIELLGS
jgi:hypothetical protein